MTLIDLLHKTARALPNHPAMTIKRGYRTYTISYKELYDLAQRCAVLLQESGITPGENVVLLAPNSPFWVIVFFGTLMRACRIVPLNVQSTPEFVHKTIRQTQARIFFKHRLFNVSLERSVRIIDIDFLDELLIDYDPQKYEKINIQESDIAEILYTSGTTGDPKGSLLTHANLTSNVTSVAHLIPTDPEHDRILSILPLSHILEQTVGMLLPIYKGIHIIYAHSPAMIADLMHQYRITKMVGVPEFLQIIRSRINAHIQKSRFSWLFNKIFSIAHVFKSRWLARNILFRAILKNFGGKLDTIASGGAPLDPELERWWNTIGIIILQGYGLTETSPIVTINTYTVHRFGSVGKPIKNVHVKITEDGEILVKGPNVFQGYYQNSEQTKLAFTEDHWFKTGDMGVFNQDHFLFLRGRKKYMILGPGGQNVFPEDVEEVLNRTPGVKDSTIIGLEQPGGSVEIHAVLLLTQDAPDTEEIITMANKKLASYQQITGWTVWHEQDFPRSATRKVKKEIVRAFLQGKHTQGPEHQHKNPLIRLLAQITNIPAGSIRTDSSLVRDLKLDSLKRVELVARLEQDMHVIIDESVITPKLTVQELQIILDKKEPIAPSTQLAHWPRTAWAKFLRILLQEPFLLFSKLFMRVQVYGLSNLHNVRGPVIFMPTHLSNWDPVIVARALPRSWRYQLSFAGAQDVIYDTYWYAAWLADLVFNCFSLPRQENQAIRSGLENTGQMLDQGYSVVVFPEGKISLDGNLSQLKEGTGVFATQMGATIIPIRIYGAQQIFPYDTFIPRSRGTVKVFIGTPLTFPRTTPASSATKEIQRALSDL